MPANRRDFLRRTSLALAGGLVLGDAALELFERLTHRKVFTGWSPDGYIIVGSASGNRPLELRINGQVVPFRYQVEPYAPPGQAWVLFPNPVPPYTTARATFLPYYAD